MIGNQNEGVSNSFRTVSINEDLESLNTEESKKKHK